MTAGPNDFADIPPTDLDDVENQNEEDDIFGWSETEKDVPADEE
jgi:hypothetical protein